MGAFIDCSCPKCGRRYGWFGSMKDRIACPSCKHLVPVNDNNEKELALMEDFLRAKMLGDATEMKRLETLMSGGPKLSDLMKPKR